MGDTMDTVLAALGKPKRVLLTTHVEPDGDGLGCEVALALGLSKLGFEVTIINDGPLPHKYRFLTLPAVFFQHVANAHFDVAITLDSPTLARLPADLDLKTMADTVIKIDHHVAGEDFGDINWVDTNASATGQMVFELLEFMLQNEGGVTPEVATGIYTAIAHDTGCFRHPNTTPKILRQSAKLLEKGADAKTIIKSLYRTRSWESVQLRNAIMGDIRWVHGRDIAIGCATQAMYQQFNATWEDTDDVVIAINEISGVKITAFLREDAPDSVKLSLRTKEEIDVCAVARSFGGGGHVKAAGATLAMGFDEAVEAVASALEAAL